MDDRLAEVLRAIRGAGAGELEGIERALEQRRRELGLSEKTGEAAAVSQRGPYWYFRYHEGGRQRKLYLGITDDPEGSLEEKLAARGAKADEDRGSRDHHKHGVDRRG